MERKQPIPLEDKAREIQAKCPILHWLRWEQLSEATKDEYKEKARKALGIDK